MKKCLMNACSGDVIVICEYHETYEYKVVSKWTRMSRGIIWIECIDLSSNNTERLTSETYRFSMMDDRLRIIKAPNKS